MRANAPQTQLRVWCLDLSELNDSAQFVVLAFGVFLCYFLYGVLQEFIFRIDGFRFGLYLTLCQFIVYTIITKVQIMRSRQSTHGSRIPTAMARVSQRQYRRDGVEDARGNSVTTVHAQVTQLHPVKLQQMDLQSQLPAKTTEAMAQTNGKIMKDQYAESGSTSVPPSLRVVDALDDDLTNDDKKRFDTPLDQYAVIALLSVATMGMSNMSVQFLSYPTQVLFKSCKPIPVMIVGALYLHKRYSTKHYAAVVLLVFGMVIFQAGNTLADAQFNLIGVGLVCGALSADALIGNVQEKVMRLHHATTTEMVYYTKMIGCVYLFVFLVLKGELLPAMYFFYLHPFSYVYVLAFSMCGCVGEVFVMSLIKRFSALVAVITTSVRKVFTIVFSFIIFPKPVSLMHIVGMFFVFAGIGMNIWIKNSSSIKTELEYLRLKRGPDANIDNV